MSEVTDIVVEAPDLSAPEPPDPTIGLGLHLPPVETVVEPIVVVPELRYSYQPTDEQGRPLGGVQVIVYKTPDELADKLRDQNVSLVRKLREVTRKQRLGIEEDEELPADLDRMPDIPKFEKKAMTPEERFQLSQDLNDPEKFEAARDQLLDSAGYNELRETVKAQQFTTNQLVARTNAMTFFERHPEFDTCADNLTVLTSWMMKKGLQPTVKNFEIAQEKLQAAGLLVATPIVREEPPVLPAAEPPVVEEDGVLNSQAPVVPDTRISEAGQPQTKRQAHVPSGLNSRVASNTGPLPATNTLTLADIDRMPADLYKKRLADPKFAKLVDDLEAKRPPRPRRS
jgi:hypothetical protein